MDAHPPDQTPRPDDPGRRMLRWSRIEEVLARLGAADRAPADLLSRIMRSIHREVAGELPVVKRTP